MYFFACFSSLTSTGNISSPTWKYSAVVFSWTGNLETSEIYLDWFEAEGSRASSFCLVCGRSRRYSLLSSILCSKCCCMIAAPQFWNVQIPDKEQGQIQAGTKSAWSRPVYRKDLFPYSKSTIPAQYLSALIRYQCIWNTQPDAVPSLRSIRAGQALQPQHKRFCWKSALPVF